MTNDEGNLSAKVQKRKHVKITAMFQKIEDIVVTFVKKMSDRGLPILVQC